jgi:hypothetical protein
MRRLLKILAIVFILFATSVSMVVLAARTKPLSDHLTLLHLDQCAPPCWLGIRPGQPAIPGAAEAALKTAYPAPLYSVERNDNCLTDSAECFFIVSKGTSLFRVQINRRATGQVTNTITSIMLAFDDPYTQRSAYTFGDFYALFGEPVRSRLFGTFKFPQRSELKEVLYVRPDSMVIVTGFDGDLTTDPAKQVKVLHFLAPDPDLSALATQQQQNNLYPWTGFMTSQRFWTKSCVRRSMC